MLKIIKCPTCGSDRLKRVRRTVTGQIRGQPYMVPEVVVYHCPVCGEELYDPEAMKKIEAVRKKRRERRSGFGSGRRHVASSHR